MFRSSSKAQSSLQSTRADRQQTKTATTKAAQQQQQQSQARQTAIRRHSGCALVVVSLVVVFVFFCCCCSSCSAHLFFFYSCCCCCYCAASVSVPSCQSPFVLAYKNKNIKPAVGTKKKTSPPACTTEMATANAGVRWQVRVRARQ